MRMAVHCTLNAKLVRVLEYASNKNETDIKTGKISLNVLKMYVSKPDRPAAIQNV